MRRLPGTLIVIPLMLCFVACNLITTQSTLVETPVVSSLQTILPSAIHPPTEESIQNDDETPTPNVTAIQPTQLPTVQEAIVLISPSSGSTITSPITVSGAADSTFEQNIGVSITGEDGKVLVSSNALIQAELGKRGDFSTSLDFQTDHSQPGRISVFDTSARDGSLNHLASVEVILNCCQSIVGEPAVADTNLERIIIKQPSSKAEVSGGKISLQGEAQDAFENHISISLCGEGGNGSPDTVCGTKDNHLADSSANIQTEEMGGRGPFAGELTYHITSPITGSIKVYITSPRDGGIVHLTSISVRLLP
jgi:hypothetical protein